MTSVIGELLRSTRQRIHLVEPTEAARLRDAGALLVDTRPDFQRASFGSIPAPRGSSATTSSGGSSRRATTAAPP